MIEEALKTGIGTLLTQGVLGFLCLVLGIVVWLQDKRITSCNKTALDLKTATEAAVREQFEKRLAQFELVVDAMNRNTTTLAAVQMTVEARTLSVNQLVEGFANLVRDLEANREIWKQKGDAWNLLLSDIRGRLEELQRRNAA